MNRQSLTALTAISSMVLVGLNPSSAQDQILPGGNRQTSPLPDWLRGKWVFDEEQTQKKYAAAKPAEGLDAVRHGLVYPQLVEQLKGARVTVTDSEVVMTTRDGNGKAFPFQLLEAANGESVTLKQSDGEVTTYHKDGDRLWTASTGNVNIPFYFKRAQ
jgi:hypothetical protein